MWKLCIDDDQANRTIVELVREEYSIGRAEDNAVRLTERNISRHHAKLRLEKERWVLIDLKSSNGSFAGGRKLDNRKVLESGETVSLGDYRLRVVDAATDSVPTPEAQAAVSSRRQQPAKVVLDRLIVLVGPVPLAEFPLGHGLIKVGRGEECDVRLDDTSVSRVHVTLQELTDGVYQARDEGSSNGLRINGREVTEAVLTPDDLIELGDVELVFVPRGRSFDPKSYHPKAWSSAQRVVERVRDNPKLALSAVGGAILFGAALFFFGSSSDEATQPARSPATRALDEAEEQMLAGQLEVAHETLQVINADSNLRQSERFREIERRWADDQFERAQRAASGAEERHILERIARAPSVDSARRKRASELLSTLAESDLVPTDLPKAWKDAGLEPEPRKARSGAVPRKPSSDRVIDLDSEPVRPKATSGGKRGHDENQRD
jgi:ABC transport system ATP-binding/permease protein